MTWLAFLYTLSLGTMHYQLATQDSASLSAYMTPPGTFTTNLSAELIVGQLAFLRGSVETWETSNRTGLFNPSQSFYTVTVGIRSHGIELGYTHECDHMTLSSFLWPDSGFMANRDSVYLKFSGSVDLWKEK